MEGQQPGQKWVFPTPGTARLGEQSAEKAGMPLKNTTHFYHTSPCAEDNTLAFHPGRPYFLL